MQKEWHALFNYSIILVSNERAFNNISIYAYFAYKPFISNVPILELFVPTSIVLRRNLNVNVKTLNVRQTHLVN